jgi:hypothetical protein
MGFTAQKDGVFIEFTTVKILIGQTKSKISNPISTAIEQRSTTKSTAFKN